jgi:hypothetical protein
MAASSSVSPGILDGDGPSLFSGYSPHATSTAGLPPGPDPHLLAGYVVLFLLPGLPGWVPLYFVLSSDSLVYCLLSRFERYQREGGPSDFSSFVMSLGKSFRKVVPVKDFVSPRQRRMTGSERAAAKQREQKEAFKQKKQGLKLAATSTAEIGFQVLSSLLPVM